MTRWLGGGMLFPQVIAIAMKMARWLGVGGCVRGGLKDPNCLRLKLFIQHNTQKNTKEIASYIEQVFILWHDKDIPNILIIFILLMNKTC